MLAHTADRALAPAERRRLGQHYTPAPVADLIVAACVRRPGASVLDPACGAGAFLVRAAERLAALGGGGRLLGLELDPAAAALTREALAGHPAEIRCADAFAPGELGPVDALVANPPLPRAPPRRRPGPPRRDRRRGRAGLARPAPRWPGGRLRQHAGLRRRDASARAAASGWSPAGAWLDAAYGEALQRFLATRFRLLAVIEPRAEAWFADAAVNPVILLAERADPQPGAVVRLAGLHRPLGELLAGGWPAADGLVDDLLAGRAPHGSGARRGPPGVDRRTARPARPAAAVSRSGPRAAAPAGAGAGPAARPAGRGPGVAAARPDDPVQRVLLPVRRGRRAVRDRAGVAAADRPAGRRAAAARAGQARPRAGVRRARAGRGPLRRLGRAGARRCSPPARRCAVRAGTSCPSRRQLASCSARRTPSATASGSRRSRCTPTSGCTWCGRTPASTRSCWRRS